MTVKETYTVTLSKPAALATSERNCRFGLHYAERCFYMCDGDMACLFPPLCVSFELSGNRKHEVGV